MRCSSCEPLLDRYIEGTLKPREMIAISAHLRQCAPCRELLEELKAVDGLLATTDVSALPENFTFAIMAEVRTLPAPRARQHPVWSFLALYSAAAWVAVVLAMALTGTHPTSVLAAVSSGLARLGLFSASVSSNVSHGLTHIAPALAAFGAGVLLIDFAIAGAFALLYFVIRPRLAARLASFPESSS
ncbi:MAG TPA: zf-HC2 domain-containing protein [Candidatus Baltobacteraceae bacterium]|nr:zf-HC2 domain-containing protein [Candidatus Baltobacteraceae bacterium]